MLICRHLQVVDMEYRLNHESIPLNEEKQMVRDIKRLHSQRPRVRQFEAMAADQEQTRAAARAAPQAGPTLGEMEQERKVRRCAGLRRPFAEMFFEVRGEPLQSHEGHGEGWGPHAPGLRSEWEPWDTADMCGARHLSEVLLGDGGAVLSLKLQHPFGVRSLL